MDSAKPIKKGKGRLWIYSILLIGMFFFNYWVPHRFNYLNIQYSNKIFDRNKIFIGYTPATNFYTETEFDKAIAINDYSEIPDNLLNALSSLEDKNLNDSWQNRFRLRMKGFIRAIVFVGTKGGGSGVPQQLVKNLFILNQSPLNRKITETQISSAMYLDWGMKEIIMLYLNNVSFGNNIRGFKSAAAFFFGKGLNQCSTTELAMLVGMLDGPALYYDTRDKTKNTEKNETAVKRRNLVLKEMLEDKKITQKQYNQYSTVLVNFKFDTQLSKYATTKTLQFDDYVKQELNNILKDKKIDADVSNLNIYTYFDINAQKAAEATINSFWKNNFSALAKKPQVALVTLDATTGGIVTMIGGNPSSGWIGSNRAIVLDKPVGSAFKPFFYGAMFEKGFTLNDSLPDKDISKEHWKWIAKNSNGTVSGQNLTLLQCITYSKNVPVCYAMNKEDIKPSDIISLAKRCGIKEDLPDNMQIAIGGLTSSVSPLEMDAVYECILNNGNYLPPHAIAKIEIPGRGKEKAKVVYEYNPTENEKIAMNEAIAGELKTCLESVVNNGTAAAVKKYYNGYAAGKTGTSDENKDAWFVGFTKDKATAVWVGYDDSKTSLPAQYNQGGKVAAPIWGMYMKQLANKK